MSHSAANATSHRPLIGVVPSYVGGRPTVSAAYLDSIWRAGGLGVMLPYTAEPGRLRDYAALFDGFLFTGGVDLDPTLYGEVLSAPQVEIDPQRDAFEATLFEVIYPLRKPILGICRGIQAINVWLGGTLYQHMEGHSQTQPGEERPLHISLMDNGFLHRLCGKTDLWVNSFHHQAVKELAPDLRADAHSGDGFIEAAYAPEHPFLVTVQFHPEMYNHLPDDDHSRLLFGAFVGACERDATHFAGQ